MQDILSTSQLMLSSSLLGKIETTIFNNCMSLDQVNPFLLNPDHWNTQDIRSSYSTVMKYQFEIEQHIVYGKKSTLIEYSFIMKSNTTRRNELK